MGVAPAEGITFDIEVPVLVIGAGAAGLVAALRAREAGAEVLVVERDAVPQGSTALSAGLVPAAGTRWQREAGVADDPARFVADIMAKAGGEPDPTAAAAAVGEAGLTLEWLADQHGLPFAAGFPLPRPLRAAHARAAHPLRRRVDRPPASSRR